MKKNRPVVIFIVALAVALAPVTCVCADWLAFEAPATAVQELPSDCHSAKQSVALDAGDPCSGCDDGTFANVSKTESNAFDPGPLGFAVAAHYPPPHALYSKFPSPRDPPRRSTPVTLHAVLLI